MSDNPKWIRHRFKTKSEDYRPLVFPPPGPYWCSAGFEPPFTLIAYLPPEVDLLKYWPEAEHIDSEEEDSIIYTSRFPKPKWWTGE
jgi:hypothetical protein